MLSYVFLIDMLDDMQQAVANKDIEYQDTINDISEDRVQLQIKLEKATIQIEQLKEEQKRADEILNKAGLMDNSGDAEFGIGRVSANKHDFVNRIILASIRMLTR